MWHDSKYTTNIIATTFETHHFQVRLIQCSRNTVTNALETVTDVFEYELQHETNKTAVIDKNKKYIYSHIEIPTLRA